jgi:hypothetical protein
VFLPEVFQHIKEYREQQFVAEHEAPAAAMRRPQIVAGPVQAPGCGRG